MHSKLKVSRMYPQVNEKNIRQLYGYRAGLLRALE